MQGLHLTADLYQCRCDPGLLINADTLAALCNRHTVEAGLTVVADKWHPFPEYNDQPGGVTGMVLLAESHLAVHTWPERGGVTLDVYVCNFTCDNSGKARSLLEALIAAFEPAQVQRQHLDRGDEHGPVESQLAASAAGTEARVYLEALGDHAEYGFRFSRQLLSHHTGLQQLELLESPELGRTLRLDGHFMTSEREEFFYHEALVHPAALAHPGPRTALIVGGGDGGALEELLKHPSLEQISLVELDAGVIEVARTHLAQIHHGAFDDPRVSVHIRDGEAFVRESHDSYDLILLDLTDPETPAGPLYTPVFFKACQRILAPGGALVMHLGSPFHTPERVRGLAQGLRSVFPQVHGYGLHIPLYGAYWGLAVASDVLNPLNVGADQIASRLAQRNIGGLRYYNPGVHGALFALPNFYQALVA